MTTTRSKDTTWNMGGPSRLGHLRWHEHRHKIILKGEFAMTITPDQLLQHQYEVARRHEIEMFKRWLATATREGQVDCDKSRVTV